MRKSIEWITCGACPQYKQSANFQSAGQCGKDGQIVKSSDKAIKGCGGV